MVRGAMEEVAALQARMESIEQHDARLAEMETRLRRLEGRERVNRDGG
jgi:hypothetical protein